MREKLRQATSCKGVGKVNWQIKDNEATQRLTTIESPLPLGMEGKREEIISPELSNWDHPLGAGIVDTIQLDQKQGCLAGSVTIEETWPLPGDATQSKFALH